MIKCYNSCDSKEIEFISSVQNQCSFQPNLLRVLEAQKYFCTYCRLPICPSIFIFNLSQQFSKRCHLTMSQGRFLIVTTGRSCACYLVCRDLRCRYAYYNIIACPMKNCTVPSVNCAENSKLQVRYFYIEIKMFNAWRTILHGIHQNISYIFLSVLRDVINKMRNILGQMLVIIYTAYFMP